MINKQDVKSDIKLILIKEIIFSDKINKELEQEYNITFNSLQHPNSAGKLLRKK